jgi:chitin synthase
VRYGSGSAIEEETDLRSGLTGSGKSTTSRHFTSQVLQLASSTKAQRRLSDQVSSLFTVLESFGHSKTQLNPSASQHGRYLELHFATEGRIAGAKVLPFGLNKSRIGRLRHEERTFHVFYQLLAGASPEEREALNLEDPSSYALLSSSGCYRLPGGPFSDDSTQLSELRVALASLGFKAKHVRSIFTTLTTILLLSNLTFTDDRAYGSLGMTSMDERARIAERQTLIQAAGHLGVAPDDLEAVLVNRTKWVRRDLCSMFLDAQGAASQRDALIRDLYAILYTFIVEMANKRLAPELSETQIIQLDLPGYQSRTQTAEVGTRPPSAFLVNASGENGFDEFSVNFMNEVVQSYVLRRAFEDGVAENEARVADGIRLPAVVTMDNAACVELLRGGVLGFAATDKQPAGLVAALARASEDLKGEEKDEIKTEKLLGSLSSFTRHASFSIPQQPRRSFAINHYAGQCSYDATDFVDRNADVLDKQLVDLLRSSSDLFIAKLVSGPGLATEGHPLDPNITVEAQVTVTPLRTPTAIDGAGGAEWPIDISVPQPVTAQLNATISTMLTHLARTRIWTVACIRPNDSGHANSFDKRRVKAQVRALLLPDLINRLQIDYVADYTYPDFCTRHGIPLDQPPEEVDAFAQDRAWVRGVDYDMGQERVWLGWEAWKDQEDLLRSGEVRRGSGEETLAESDESEEFKPPSAHRYGDGGVGPGRADSSEDLLLRRKTTLGESYSPNDIGGYTGYLDSPDLSGSAVWSAYDKPEPATPNYDAKELPEGDGMVVHEKRHQATEVIATTSARRWWIRITWALTWWIPSFLLRSIGGMKRPDIRMAWREKLAIFMMVFFACGIVLFYIIIFGKLLCPDSDKAWNPTELSQHAGTDDYYAAIAGKVYDVSNR